MKTNFFKFLIATTFIHILLLFNSFYVAEHQQPVLVLDATTKIYPIIDNEEYPDKSFIRTLKVNYKDINKRYMRADSSYYRCAFHTKIILYAPFDSLELNSVARKSCEITAFFNLEEEEKKWITENYFYFIKIINVDTKYELILENTQPRFLSNIFIKYNRK